MKAKVNLRDNYTGRNINIICEVENVALNGQTDDWCYMSKYLSDYQRKKIKDFFGVMQAYYTTAEIIKLYPSPKYIYKIMLNKHEFDNFKNMTMKEIIYYIRHHYNCNKLKAEKIIKLYLEQK